MTINLLFICSQNKWFSPTAEYIYRQDFRVKERSAGTNSSTRKRISARDITWADLLLVMEQKHKKEINRKYRHLDLPQIFVLDIADNYQYMDIELVEIIRISTENILSNWDH